MSKIPSFLKKDGERILFNQEGELIYYVPESYFTKDIAEINGEYVTLLGILDYAIFDTNGKTKGLKRFNCPTMFMCKPTSIEKLKNVKLTKYIEAKDYRILKFKKGDEVISSIHVPEMVSNAETFFRLLLTGDLPTTIPYDKLHEYFPNNVRMNGGDYGLNMQMYGIIVSEMARDPNNVKRPFRYSNMNNMNEYTCINIRLIPKYITAYTSITSEVWDEGILNASMNKNTRYVPLENLLTT